MRSRVTLAAVLAGSLAAWPAAAGAEVRTGEAVDGRDASGSPTTDIDQVRARYDTDGSLSVTVRGHGPAGGDEKTGLIVFFRDDDPASCGSGRHVRVMGGTSKDAGPVTIWGDAGTAMSGTRSISPDGMEVTLSYADGRLRDVSPRCVYVQSFSGDFDMRDDVRLPLSGPAAPPPPGPEQPPVAEVPVLPVAPVTTPAKKPTKRKANPCRRLEGKRLRACRKRQAAKRKREAAKRRRRAAT